MQSGLDILGKLQISRHGWVVEGRGLSFFLPTRGRAPCPSSLSPKAGLRKAVGQMADGRPHQCYQEMVIRFQGLGWLRETREACISFPHCNHCTKIDLRQSIGCEVGLGAPLLAVCLQTRGDKGDLRSR